MNKVYKKNKQNNYILRKTKLVFQRNKNKTKI